MCSSQLVRHQKRHFSDQFKSYSKFFFPTQRYLVDISPHLLDKTLYFQIYLVWCMEEKLNQHYSLSKNQPFLFFRKKCLTKHYIVHSLTFLPETRSNICTKMILKLKFTIFLQIN